MSSRFFKAKMLRPSTVMLNDLRFERSKQFKVQEFHELRGQILMLDLTPFPSSTFQSAPTDSGHFSEVQEVSSSKVSFLNAKTT